MRSGSSCAQKSHLPKRSGGFTLPELVVTLVVLGILAAVIIPRFAKKSDFDVFGYAEQTREALRFAQKSAIAKRRLVCVAIASNTISIQFASAFGASSCNTALINPATGKAYGLASQDAAPSGVSINALSFNFDALGHPGFAANQTLTVTGGSATESIVIEAETGYVH